MRVESVVGVRGWEREVSNFFHLEHVIFVQLEPLVGFGICRSNPFNIQSARKPRKRLRLKLVSD